MKNNPHFRKGFFLFVTKKGVVHSMEVGKANNPLSSLT